MLHNLTLETSLGIVDFTIFYFSPWLKGYFIILWTLVVLSNACSLLYIYRKLNLSNVVNLIPLLDCVINLIAFLIIAISSVNLWCKAVVLISKTLLLSGKFFEIICKTLSSSISIINPRPFYILLLVNHKICDCC